jgi:hypothetical protein
VGGRRARSVSEIVGGGLSAQEGQLTRAIAEENPQGIAVSSAKLLADSKKTTDIFYYISKLTDFVKSVVESGRDLSYEERETLARKEWSRIKREEKLEDDPIVTRAVISAVAKAIAKGRK